MFLLLLLALVVLAGVGGVQMTCPKSASSVHAGCEVTTSFKDSCSSVQAEIKARVNGQYEAWHDPHNNGTYTLISSSDSTYELSRLTGDKKYTDQIIFSFESLASGACDVAACSESQVSKV